LSFFHWFYSTNHDSKLLKLQLTKFALEIWWKIKVLIAENWSLILNIRRRKVGCGGHKNYFILTKQEYLLGKIRLFLKFFNEYLSRKRTIQKLKFFRKKSLKNFQIDFYVQIFLNLENTKFFVNPNKSFFLKSLNQCKSY